MDIRQLEIFTSVIDSGGFLSAAEKLHLSQSTVSAHIAALEQELGTELIRRTTRTFEPTVEGRQLYAYAADILALQRKALRELSGGKKKLIRIGSSSVPAQCLVPPLLAAFEQKQPEIQYEITRADSVEIIDRVASGALDIGFVGTKSDSPCVFLPIASDRLVLAAPNTEHYQCLLREGVSIADILKHPFLMREDKSGTMREARRFFEQAGISISDINISARIDDAETLRLCIAEGLGISIVSCRAVEELVQQDRILILPLEDVKLYRELYIVYRDSRYPPRSVRDFVSFAEDWSKRQE